MNLDRSVELAVTYCHLTGSALAFDRAPVSGARMGVSGLLLHENLVMLDRNERPSLWAQMSSTSLCEGPKDERLPRWSVLEVRWETWRTLHPGTLVLDMSGDASGTPAGTVVGSPARNQRVIGAPSSPEEPGVAFPFETVVDLPGDRQVLPFEWKGKDYRLLWSDGAMGGWLTHR